MDSPPLPLSSKDVENLRLLEIFHYVAGAVGFLLACIPVIHLIVGIAIIMAPTSMNSHGEPPPAVVGWLFAGLAIVFILLGWTMAGCTIVSGRMIARRKRRMFSFVLGAILCMFFPFGTALGVFTIILLNKDSVKSLYA